MSFNIGLLTDPSQGRLKLLKDAIDDFSESVIYREDELNELSENIGVDSSHELGPLILQEIENMTKNIRSWKYKLDTINFGKGPTGTTPDINFGP